MSTTSVAIELPTLHWWAELCDANPRDLKVRIQERIRQAECALIQSPTTPIPKPQPGLPPSGELGCEIHSI